ncbi:hypothetical protein [Mycolicibacterium iranicum]|uniref:Uncharacterized protein n=1 Tax=Mycolicibacterium iranicum TaxID=912594 RepID=A0ABT4HQM9_MYCIR|nr:hypothetical protein [Mycolicibacterium iranicum]MCZ0732504.1 hypothetical protein [Mycolicibacterium iranicum]
MTTPNRPSAAVWVIAAAIVVAGCLVAGAIWLIRTDDRAVPATTAAPTATPAPPSGSVVADPSSPIYTSSTCVAWRDAQPRLDAVPLPAANWVPNSPEGRAAVAAWSQALDPILADLQAAGERNAPAAEALTDYVTSQRDSIAAAQRAAEGTEPYSSTYQGEVLRATTALDAVCGR